MNLEDFLIGAVTAVFLCIIMLATVSWYVGYKTHDYPQVKRQKPNHRRKHKRTDRTGSYRG